MLPRAAGSAVWIEPLGSMLVWLHELGSRPPSNTLGSSPLETPIAGAVTVAVELLFSSGFQLGYDGRPGNAMGTDVPSAQARRPNRRLDSQRARG
jgi:hypothetical protein